MPIVLTGRLYDRGDTLIGGPEVVGIKRTLLALLPAPAAAPGCLGSRHHRGGCPARTARSSTSSTSAWLPLSRRQPGWRGRFDRPGTASTGHATTDSRRR